MVNVNMKKDLAVDLDGVVWDAHQPFLDVYNKNYNKNIKIEDINKWGFFPEEEFWKTYAQSSKLIMDYELQYHVKSNLLMLKSFFNISFVTHGMYDIVDIEKKLGKHGIYPGIIYDKVIVDDRSKLKARLDFDFFIDDNPHMIADIQQYPNKILLLFAQPWNKDLVYYYESVVRVNGWNDVSRYFFNKFKEITYGKKKEHNDYVK